jgi:hypothetical protein
LNVSATGVERPPPDGVIVIVPVYTAFGITVKFAEAMFNAPPVGPEKVKLLAGAAGVAELDALEATLIPLLFEAVTVQV